MLSGPVAALLVAGGLLSLLVVTGATVGVDQAILTPLNRADGVLLVHDLARVIVVAGQYRLVEPVVLAVAGWAAYRTRRWRDLAVTAGALLALDGGAWVLKHAVGRTAPRTGLDHLLAGGTSFPSGHVATATVSTLLIVQVLAGARGWTRQSARNAWWVAAAVSVLVGVAAVVLAWHWPTDVVGGWIAGAAVFLAAQRLFDASSAPAADPQTVLVAAGDGR